MKVVARIHNDYKSKFGIPRQSGLVDSVQSAIVFEPEYRDENAVRGLSDYSHIWLLWEFSESVGRQWSPTVRPPRLGGNVRVGVFATRAPFRANPIGLSSVKLDRIEITEEGPVLYVDGADLLDGTPIYDIKPYLPHIDCHPEATAGFAGAVKEHSLDVEIPEDLKDKIPAGQQQTIIDILKQDPRPGYQNDEERIYGMTYGQCEIKFKVRGNELSVTDIIIKKN